jgi:hypothetical protein
MNISPYFSAPLRQRINEDMILRKLATNGSAMTHHPHVHGIVPGGGLSLDGEKWVSCKRGFFLPVRGVFQASCRLKFKFMPPCSLLPLISLFQG